VKLVLCSCGRKCLHPIAQPPIGFKVYTRSAISACLSTLAEVQHRPPHPNGLVFVRCEPTCSGRIDPPSLQTSSQQTALYARGAARAAAGTSPVRFSGAGG
jgi:hypothetical protein